MHKSRRAKDITETSRFPPPAIVGVQAHNAEHFDVLIDHCGASHADGHGEHAQASRIARLLGYGVFRHGMYALQCRKLRIILAVCPFLVQEAARTDTYVCCAWQ